MAYIYTDAQGNILTDKSGNILANTTNIILSNNISNHKPYIYINGQYRRVKIFIVDSENNLTLPLADKDGNLLYADEQNLLISNLKACNFKKFKLNIN